MEKRETEDTRERDTHTDTVSGERQRNRNKSPERETRKGRRSLDEEGRKKRKIKS